jgi:hypothetical protein
MAAEAFGCRCLCAGFEVMRYLGALCGSGVIESAGEAIGRADYEFDGYLMRPREIVASGEVRMKADELTNAFGRRNLVLRTDDGRLLPIVFSRQRMATSSDAAHVDVRGGLPDLKDWPRGR